MIEIEEAWMGYFQELDPQVRLERFNALADLEDEAQEFCRQIYQERYTDPKYPDRKVDTWLWKLVYLPGLYRRRKFLRGALKKEIGRTCQELHLEKPEALSEVQETILFLEFRNAARRYLKTCDNERYGSTLFGMKKASAQQQRDKACEDIWMASRGVAHAAGMDEQLRLWCEALFEELLVYDPASQERYAELERKSR